MASEDKLFKLQQYQRTQQLIHDLNFEKATQLPLAAGAEGSTISAPQSSSSYLLRRTQDSVSKSDMSLIRGHLKVMSEIDPANPYYSSLLERINHGERLGWKEFENAINRFSSQEYYLTKLQDEINNAKVNLQLHDELPGEEATLKLIDQPITPLSEENEPEPPPHNEPAEPSAPGPTHTQPTHTQPTPLSPRYGPRPPAFTKQTEEKLNKANQSMQETKSKLTGPEEAKPQLSDKMSQRLNSATKSMQRPTANGTSPQRTIPPNRIRSARPPIITSQNRKKAAATLLRGAGSGSGFGIPWVPKFLQRWTGNLARGAARLAWNIGSSLGRAAINALTRAAAQLLPRIAVQTAARGVFLGLGTTGLAMGGFISIAIIYFIVMFWTIYDLNTECGQPGKVELNKTAEKEKYEPGEQIKYTITLNYNIKCTSAYLDKVEVKDSLPTGTTYVPNSAKSTKVAELPPPIEQIEDPLLGEEGANTLPGQIDPEFPTGNDIHLDGNTLTWRLGKVEANTVITMSFSVTADQTDTWLINQATAGYTIVSQKGLFSGGTSDVTGLLPNPLTPPPPNWDSIKSDIIAAFNKYPELVDVYKQASAESGVAWQALAGLHYVETGSNPRPSVSLVSGRAIGIAEPDISAAKCAQGITGPGIPIPMGGGCGFANQTESAIYAAKHLAEKIGKVPSTFPEAVEAMSRYNGGGNANCGEGLDYGPCPPQFYGEDDPYAMADFDEAHSNLKMYVIFCGDKRRCNPPEVFKRPGAMGVVRALVEAGL